MVSLGGSATSTTVQTGGAIDLAYIPYAAGITATIDSATDVLSVTGGAITYSQTLAGDRDDGNRWLFRNADRGRHRPPQAPCAPVLTGGPAVVSIWRRLMARAGPRRHAALTRDPDLHLLADGARIDAVARIGDAYCFQLGAAVRAVREGWASRCAGSRSVAAALRSTIRG